MDVSQLVALVTAVTALVGAISAGMVAVLTARRTGEVHQAVSDDLQTIAQATPGVSPADLATPIVVEGRPAPNAAPPGLGASTLP